MCGFESIIYAGIEVKWFFHGEGGPILNCFDRLNDVLLTNSALKYMYIVLYN